MWNEKEGYDAHQNFSDIDEKFLNKQTEEEVEKYTNKQPT